MKRLKRLFGLLLGSLVLFSACGGGGSKDPTGPTIPDVSGNWFFSGVLTSNTCRFLQGEPGFEHGTSAIELLNITQNGPDLTALATGAGTIFSNGRQFTGTVTENNSVTLVMSNPHVSTAGSCTSSLGGGADVLLTDGSTSAGTGSVNLTVTHVGGNCSPLGPLPCSVVWTGNWSKRNTAKSVSSPSSREEIGVERLLDMVQSPTTLKEHMR